MPETLFGAQEFAERAGVTVRALHHYDRMGLLPPRGRTDAGYRLYGERELARLQQIVVLKFIGLSLREIKDVLGHSDERLANVLAAQTRLVAEKRRHLDQVAEAIGQATGVLERRGTIDWPTLKNIIEVIEMKKDMAWVKDYYTEEQLAEMAKGAPTPEEQAVISEKWTVLGRDIEAAKHEDPAGARAQALAARYAELIDAFTGGNAAIAANLKKLYADKQSWPKNPGWQMPYGEEGGVFIQKAVAIYRAARP